MGDKDKEKHLTSAVGTGHSGGPLSLLSVLGKRPPLELTRLVLEQVRGSGANRREGAGIQMRAPHLRPVQRT